MVEADHVGAACQQRLRVQARTAAGVEHAESRHIAEEIKDRGSIVERVVRAIRGMSLLCVGERIEQRRIGPARSMPDEPEGQTTSFTGVFATRGNLSHHGGTGERRWSYLHKPQETPEVTGC